MSFGLISGLATTLGMLAYGIWVFYAAKLHKRSEFFERDINQAAHEKWAASRADAKLSQDPTDKN